MTELTPPDYEQCQVFVTPAHGPFTLGPRPAQVRCKNRPVWLAKEKTPGDDGLYGSMTLCAECVGKLLEDTTLSSRISLQAINYD